MHVLSDSGLVALDGEEIIAAFLLHHDASRFGLGIERIGCDQATIQIDSAEHGLDGGNFVGSLGHRFGAKPASLRDGIGAGDFDALAVEQFLAVDRNLIADGSPLGLKLQVGPITLAGARSPLADHEQGTVIANLQHLSHVGSRFVSGLFGALGPVWPLLLAKAAKSR